MDDTFTLWEYLDENLNEIAGYHYRERPDHIVSNGSHTLRFSSYLEEVRPESWDVLVDIYEDNELIYSGFDPSNVVEQLCLKYGNSEFFEE